MKPRLTGLLAMGVLLCTVGCGAGSPSRRGTYAQIDSPSATCRNVPAYCAKAAGEEATLTLAVRGAEVAAAGRAWQVLDELVRKSIEDILFECAKWADAEVNKTEFGGRAPTAKECEEQVGGTRENPVTRGMRLGSAKHRLALQCTEEKLSRAHSGRFSLEQRYRLPPETRQLELIPHETELAMLRNGGKGLAGSVVPDVVIHTGNPLQAQLVYDFKFPCPESNHGQWRSYSPGNPLQVRNQGEAYLRVLGVTPSGMTPKGVFK